MTLLTYCNEENRMNRNSFDPFKTLYGNCFGRFARAGASQYFLIKIRLKLKFFIFTVENLSNFNFNLILMSFRTQPV
jgi:hypothetical protein